MTKEEGEKAGVSHRGYFRVNDGKMNLAPPSDKADWYHLKSIDLGNGPPRKQFEEGDKVGVVVCWDWPAPLDGIKKEDFEKVAEEIKKGKWRANPQAKFWVGHPIGKALGLDLRSKKDKSKITGMVRAWLHAGDLVEVGRMDERRKTKIFIEVAAKD